MPIHSICHRAFTFMEVMASVAIIAVLSASALVFIPNYINSATKTANETTLATLNSALADYRVSGGMSLSHSLGGTNNTTKMEAIVTAFKTGFTAGGRLNIFLNTSTPIVPARIYSSGSGRTFQFTGYGVTLAGANNSGFAGTYIPLSASPPTATIAASPTSGSAPLASTITWSSTDATTATVTLDAGEISSATSGTHNATNLTAGTHTAVLAVTGPAGSASSSATITVSAPAAPTCTVSASPAIGTAPLSSTITWSSTNATSGSLTIDGGEVGTGTSGTYSATGLAAGTHTVAISVSGPGGSVSNSTSILVLPAATPMCGISASPSSGVAPLDSTITWNSSNATSATVQLDGVTISTATSGSYSATGLAAGSHPITISVTGPGGSSSDSATITASGTDPTPIPDATWASALGTYTNIYSTPSGTALYASVNGSNMVMDIVALSNGAQTLRKTFTSDTNIASATQYYPQLTFVAPSGSVYTRFTTTTTNAGNNLVVYDASLNYTNCFACAATHSYRSADATYVYATYNAGSSIITGRFSTTTGVSGGSLPTFSGTYTTTDGQNLATSDKVVFIGGNKLVYQNKTTGAKLYEITLPSTANRMAISAAGYIYINSSPVVVYDNSGTLVATLSGAVNTSLTGKSFACVGQYLYYSGTSGSNTIRRMSIP